MMGIRPNGSGAIPPVTPDNPETRYSDWLNDLEDSGEIVGGVWQETDAKATSGNDGLADLAGRVAALEGGSVSEHTHVSADITDTTSYFGSELSADRIPRTGTDGQLHSSRDPSSGNHLTRKSWVDREVAKKANSSHSHTSADITDKSSDAPSLSSPAGKLVAWDAGGRIQTEDPVGDANPATKRYVDQQVSTLDGRVDALEGRVDALEDNTPAPRTSISGTGWRAIQYNGVVEVSLIGAEVGWTLPEGWRPSYMKYAPIADLSGQSPAARVGISPQGTVTLVSTTGACYGSLVYLL